MDAAVTATIAAGATAAQRGASKLGDGPAAIVVAARALQRRSRRLAAVSAALTGALVCEVILAAAAIAAPFAPWLQGRWRWIAAIALLLGALSAALLAWRRRSRDDLAAWCGARALPDEAEALRTALELAMVGGGSTGLRAVAIHDGARGLTAVRATVRRSAGLAGRLALAWGLLAASLVVAVPTASWRHLRRPPPAPLPRLRRVGTLVGDLRLQARPPAYAAATVRPIDVTEGDAELLRGSTIAVQARPVAGARDLRVEIATVDAALAASTPPSEGADRRPHIDADPTHHAGELIALQLVDGRVRWHHAAKAGLRYRYRGTATDGGAMVERAWRHISVRADTPPRARLRAPVGEIEVRRGDEVVIEGAVDDDIGLTRVVLAVARPTGQVQRRQVAITPGDLRVGVREALSVDSLKLEPGELATVWLEATDNNGLEGGRTGSSARVTLQMFSPERHHERLLAAVAGLALRWTLRLADRLESRPNGDTASLTELLKRRALCASSEDADLDRLRRLRGWLAEDVLARGQTGADLDEIAQRLRGRVADDNRVAAATKRDATGIGERVERGRLLRVHNRVVDAEERAVVQIAALAAAEHRAAMVRDSKALTALEKRLADVLEQLTKHPKDAALLAEAERLLDAIEARMAKIEASAARQLKVAPPEHVNAGAMNPRGMQATLKQHQGALDDVRAQLRRGDFKAALDRLTRGRKQLAGPMAALNAAAAKERSAEEDALAALVAELQRGIATAERGQAALQREVEPSAAAQRTAAAEQLRRRLQTTLPQVQRLLDDARDQVRPRRLLSYELRASRAVARGRAALSTAQQAVTQGAIGRALQALLEAREQLAAAAKTELQETGPGDGAAQRDGHKKDLQRVRTALDRSARAATRLRELLPVPEALHDLATQRALRRKVRSQGQLRRRLDQVRRRLERGGDAHPALQRQVGARLDHALGMMQQVGTSLSESDASRAQTQMAEVQSALAQARRLLEQNQRGGAGGSSGDRDQAGGQGRAGGGQGASQGDSGGDDGTGPGRGSQVKLQSGNRSDASDDFRREVLKAMKRRAPSGYDERLRRYYRGLTATPW